MFLRFAVRDLRSILMAGCDEMHSGKMAVAQRLKQVEHSLVSILLKMGPTTLACRGMRNHKR